MIHLLELIPGDDDVVLPLLLYGGQQQRVGGAALEQQQLQLPLSLTVQPSPSGGVRRHWRDMTRALLIVGKEK